MFAKCARRQPIPIVYDDIEFDEGFRADLIVNDLVIIELKSVEDVVRVHKKQLLTYLRLADKRLGYLISFGDELLRDGISRIANGVEDWGAAPRHEEEPLSMILAPSRDSSSKELAHAKALSREGEWVWLYPTFQPDRYRKSSSRRLRR
jgi:hypothetical protein